MSGLKNSDSIGPYWQCAVKTLKSKIGHAYRNNEFVDVGFLVGSSETWFPANKTILSLQSPILAAMLSNRWVTCGDGNSNGGENGDMNSQIYKIKIPDIEATPFRSFLKFLYTEEVDTTTVHVAQLMCIARKYQVDELSEACIRFVEDNISFETSHSLLKDAYKIYDTSLEEVVFKFMSRNATEFFNCEHFLLLDLETLVKLLEQENLIIDEVHLIKNVWRWAQAECARKFMEPTNENCRQVLGSGFFTIRFLHMNPNEFITNVTKLKILTCEEEIEILRHIMLPESLRQAPMTELMVGLSKWPQRKKIYTLTRIQKSEPKCAWPRRDGLSYNHRFNINHPASLVSCGFFGPLDSVDNGDKKTYTLCVNLKNLDCDFTYASVVKTVVLNSTNWKNIFHVFFKNPVPVTPGCWYTISFTIQGPPNVCGNGKPEYAVTIDSKTIPPVIVKFQDATTLNTKNQIPELSFEF